MNAPAVTLLERRGERAKTVCSPGDDDQIEGVGGEYLGERLTDSGRRTRHQRGST